MELIGLFKQGGFIMWPLLIFSIVAWTVAIQKAWFIMNFNKQAKFYQEEAMRAIKSQRYSDLEHMYRSCPEIIAKPHSAVFEEAASEAEFEARMQRRFNETSMGLKKSVWMLGTIASSAPFVGLFGTVWGIMGSFKDIGAAGKAGFAIVSHSISEALIATAAGIAVAVVALLFYNFLLVRIQDALAQFRNGLGDIAEAYNSRK